MHTTLIPAEQYINRLVDSINAAEKRVVMISLIFVEDETTRPIVEALIEAAERGVDVEICADFSTYSYKGGHGKPQTIFSPNVQELNRLAKKLRRHKIHFHWLTKNGWFMFSGRTHSKWAVADNCVLSFGGINIYEDAVSHADYMIQINDPALADYLCEEQNRIERTDQRGHAYRSHSFSHELGEVLIDGGLPFDSVIYRSAATLVKNAASVIFVSQYCPTGKLARYIKKSHNSHVYFNDSSDESIDILTRILIKTSQKVTHLDNDYQRSRYIHAKFIIATMPDGSQKAITGSHNFSYAGVAFGTKEIALLTSDKTIIKNLSAFHHEFIS